MHRIVNFFYLTSLSYPFLAIYVAGRRLSRDKGYLFKFWRKLVYRVPEIQDLEGPLQRRIRHYLFANSVTAQWFGVLHGLQLTQQEKEAGWFMAAATPIADYMVDHLGLGYDRIRTMIDQPSSELLEQITQKLFKEASQGSANGKSFHSYLKKTLIAQELSLRQTSPMHDAKMLRDITWQKGGYALLLYRTALNPSISKAEEEAIFQLGGLMQLHNDIFDLYRDLQEEIQTIPSKCSKVAVLREQFTDELEKTMELFNLLPLPQQNIRKFHLLLLLVVNTGHVCLDQFEGLEKKTGGNFCPAQYQREDLICDMEDFSKIVSTVISTLDQKF